MVHLATALARGACLERAGAGRGTLSPGCARRALAEPAHPAGRRRGDAPHARGPHDGLGRPSRRRDAARAGARDPHAHDLRPRPPPRRLHRRLRGPRRQCPLRARRPRRQTSTSSTSAAGPVRKLVAKSKSMASEEIRVNEALEAAGIRPVEMRPGRVHPPARRTSTRSTSSCPRSKRRAADVAELFSRGRRRAGLPRPGRARGRGPPAAPRDLPDAPTSGSPAPTSRVASTGSLCLVTNEGNGGLVTSLPRSTSRCSAWSASCRPSTTSPCSSSSSRAAPRVKS